MKLRILIVEDVDDDAALVSRHLVGELDCEILRAHSLAEGLDKVRDIDLVLLDIGLPDCNGAECVRRIVEATTAPVVVLTGHADDQTAIDCVAAGAYTYIFKSESNGNLRRAILAATTRQKILHQKSEELREYIRQTFAALTPESEDKDAE